MMKTGGKPWQATTASSLLIGLILGVIVTVSTNSIINWIKSKYVDNKKKDPSFVKSTEITDGIVGLIGNTPLMRIKSLSEATGCEILGKAEVIGCDYVIYALFLFSCPKDRVALNIINKAEEKGLIKPNTGCTIFEGTTGSTGISIAMVSRAKGYNAWIVVPDDQAEEKYQLLEKLGATVEKVRPVGIVDKRQYVNLAQNQFENLANFEAHYKGTGPEIFQQTNGKIDAFVAGAGTGGTIAGISRYLKPLIPNLKIYLVDPPEGKRRRHQVDTVVEGVGLNRITENFNMSQGFIDDAINVTDEEAVTMAQYLVREEGLFLGSSSAINCVGCVRVARQLGPGHRIVTMLNDSGVIFPDYFKAITDGLGITDETFKRLNQSHPMKIHAFDSGLLITFSVVLFMRMLKEEPGIKILYETTELIPVPSGNCSSYFTEEHDAPESYGYDLAFLPMGKVKMNTSESEDIFLTIHINDDTYNHLNQSSPMRLHAFDSDYPYENQNPPKFIESIETENKYYLTQSNGTN
ncbi:10257_t:CDS:10, partial [Diversispora eburnea]